MKRASLLCTVGMACTLNTSGAGNNTDVSVYDDDSSGASSDSQGSTSAEAQTEEGDTSTGWFTSTGLDGTTEMATSMAPTDTGVTAYCGDGITNLDEDCDDANTHELDGCTSTCELGPLGLVFGDIEEIPGDIGGSVGATFDGVSDCGPDEVLVGIRGVFSYYSIYFVLAQVRGVCAPVGLTNTAPTSLELGPPIDLPQFGEVLGDNPFDLVCPAGSAASGLSAATGLYTDMIGVSCRTLDLSTELDAVEFGPPTELPPFGELQAVEATLDCPADSVVAGLRVVGDDYATRFHLRCRTLGVQTE